ncbi:hypothetical protein MIR68_000628 [Amoeboaphelidium protococcarum]|nr:hypothetical protein MIR68_000628 [Amoeboaphelidium protococcarum]KAI3647562.1 hypothetical protein MP228_007783 [Amoeboaphelidium protococcarum]
MLQTLGSQLPADAAIGHQFSPYSDNGGTTLSIAGKDYCLVASDTRQSEGYEIHSRYQPHSFVLNKTCIFSGCGMYADTVELYKTLMGRLEWYRHQHDKEMSCPAVAQMLATILYGKRFFPYYVFSILSGLDEEGNGVVYSFDPVGSYERHITRAGGSSASLIQPFLDNIVEHKTISTFSESLPRDAPNKGGKKQIPLLSREEATKIARDAFTGATERDIHTGDYLEIFICDKDGVNVQKFDLKKD